MGIEPETQAIKSKGGRIRVFTGVDTPEKPLSRSEARSAAPKASLIAGYSLHLLQRKRGAKMHLFCVLFWGGVIEPETQAIQSERGESGCILA